jgi:dolichol-phosphate mannosyltransferase
MGTFMDLHIIIPTYNEADNLKNLVSALFSLSLSSGLKILVIDDNSPDGTGEISDDLVQDYPGHFSVLHRPGKLGLGTAYITGFHHALEAGADSIIQMDADFSHPPEKVVDLLAALAATDAALGSRYVPGGMVDERWPAWRKSLSAFGNIYAKNILRLPVNDATGPGGDGLYRLPLRIYLRRGALLFCGPPMGGFKDVVPHPGRGSPAGLADAL